MAVELTQLVVTKKNIYNLLSSVKDDKFIIPDYQRQYSWDKTKCEVLWGDLVDFYENSYAYNEKNEYFLGTIVLCSRKSGLEVIDGQQRITSLTLLLRVLYQQLIEKTAKTPEDEHLINRIAPCIWNVNKTTGKVDNIKKIHLESKALTDEYNDIFKNILYYGIDLNSNSNDLYTENSKFFYNQLKGYASNNPTSWYKLCIAILENCIILPVECGSFDMGLTIFSKLNDRGMSLSDSDIFKAQIYRMHDNRNKFIKDWKNLSEEVEDAHISLDDVFRYYMHIIRAENNIVDKEIGLRKFYSEKSYSIFKERKNIINDLISLAKFWKAINNFSLDIGDNIKLNYQSMKYLHCLKYYSNEYWKAITSVFYYKNKNDKEFNKKFIIFLKRLLSFLFVKSIEGYTVNNIKDPIYRACISVYKGNYDSIFKEEDLAYFHSKSFKEDIDNSNNTKISKALILLKAYLNKNQQCIIDDNFNIEHIFPKKWQNKNYKGWDRESAEEYLNKYGNKAPLEYKINIVAGNEYFGEKKKIYLGKNANHKNDKSKVMDIIDIANLPQNDWNKSDIIKRNNEFKDIIYKFFKSILVS